VHPVELCRDSKLIAKEAYSDYYNAHVRNDIVVKVCILHINMCSPPIRNGETPGSIDASVYEALGEANVDEGVCEVMKQGGGGGGLFSLLQNLTMKV
jgi:hypothetical protein